MALLLGWSANANRSGAPRILAEQSPDMGIRRCRLSSRRRTSEGAARHARGAPLDRLLDRLDLRRKQPVEGVEAPALSAKSGVDRSGYGVFVAQ